MAGPSGRRPGVNGLLLLCGLLLGGCAAEPLPGPPTAGAPSGDLRFALDLTQAPPQLARIRLRVAQAGQPLVQQERPAAFGLVLFHVPTLAPGEWQVAVSGHDAADEVLLCGLTSVTVFQGAVAQAELLLVPATRCATFETDCRDGLDDDQDGAVDCLDADCHDAPCEDGDRCTTGETCQEGLCAGGQPRVCDDGDLCTSDDCDPLTGCTTTPRICDDEVLCTVDSCDPLLGCQVDPAGCECRQDADCLDAETCTTDVCDLGTYTCRHDPVEGHPACEDGDPCTAVDTCQQGACTPGPWICECQTDQDCLDAEACTTDTCDLGTHACRHDPVEGHPACEDGHPCTAVDTCQQGVCTPGPWICECQTDQDCPLPAEPCRVRRCDASFQCTTAPAEDGAACDDGDRCTADDRCDAASGSCQGGPVPADAAEPNDSIPAATPLTIGTPLANLHLAEGEVDYFSFPAVAGGCYQLGLDGGTTPDFVGVISYQFQTLGGGTLAGGSTWWPDHDVSQYFGSYSNQTVILKAWLNAPNGCNGYGLVLQAAAHDSCIW